MKQCRFCFGVGAWYKKSKKYAIWVFRLPIWYFPIIILSGIIGWFAGWTVFFFVPGGTMIIPIAVINRAKKREGV